ncbi:hypothetical protein PAECIP111893_01079 [Paenibacillus plantiphilus]|uniref:Uncharacterized protein n=1 Tax=Paenibacillus plantiphilus TaxID=2905650 RepID=A0ABM9C092_9BACL|nr:hypothetical protein PAECIP111893_01079 [Paenibacillus plantiphilus]
MRKAAPPPNKGELLLKLLLIIFSESVSLI